MNSPPLFPDLKFRRIAVIGGGPAGASAAAALAKGGCDTVLFHKNPTHGEKPCGGGVTRRALEEFPWLRDLNIESNEIHEITLISPGGRKLTIRDREALFIIFGRGELDASLRARAVDAGAELRELEITGVERLANGFQLSFDGGQEFFDAIVAADGVFSRVRRALGDTFCKNNLCPAVDDLVEGANPAAGVTLKFYKDLTGYLWLFPRKRIASVGLVAREGELRGDLMRHRVREFVEAQVPDPVTKRSVGWAIPAPGPHGETGGVPGGERYIYCGDAAGLADPITGEGIYYAILSGELAAQALLSGNGKYYESLLAARIQPELAIAGSLAASYFRPRVLEIVIFAGRYNSRVRAIITDLLSGRQRYTDLGARIRRELGWLGQLMKLGARPGR